MFLQIKKTAFITLSTDTSNCKQMFRFSLYTRFPTPRTIQNLVHIAYPPLEQTSHGDTETELCKTIQRPIPETKVCKITKEKQE
jgi:hypothetical protein